MAFDDERTRLRRLGSLIEHPQSVEPRVERIGRRLIHLTAGGQPAFLLKSAHQLAGGGAIRLIGPLPLKHPGQLPPGRFVVGEKDAPIEQQL